MENEEEGARGRCGGEKGLIPDNVKDEEQEWKKKWKESKKISGKIRECGREEKGRKESIERQGM